MVLDSLLPTLSIKFFIISKFTLFGIVKNLARVRLNGYDCGVGWCPPWRVEITGAITSGTNQLEIEVANLWPNRLIGDQSLPESEHRT